MSVCRHQVAARLYPIVVVWPWSLSCTVGGAGKTQFKTVCIILKFVNP